MNPGTLSLVLFALLGFGLVGIAAWLEFRFQQRLERRNRASS